MNFRTFSSPQEKTPYLFAVTPRFPPLPCSRPPLTYSRRYRLDQSGHSVHMDSDAIVLCVWLLSLHTTFWRFHRCCNMSQNFISFYCQIGFCCMDTTTRLPIHHLTGIWVVCTCWLLRIMLPRTGEVLCGRVLSFLLGVNLPKSRTAASVHNCTFQLLRNGQTVSQRGRTMLHPHQQRMEVPAPPRSCQHLLSVLAGMKQYLLLCLMLMSLMMLSIISCAYWPFYVFFVEVSIRIIAHCKLGYVSHILSCKRSLCVLGTRPLSDMWFVKIFSQSVGCLVTFLIVSFKAQCF